MSGPRLLDQEGGLYTLNLTVDSAAAQGGTLDTASVAPLTAPVSRDDVILANDGGFIGLAKDYE